MLLRRIESVDSMLSPGVFLLIVQHKPVAISLFIILFANAYFFFFAINPMDINEIKGMLNEILSTGISSLTYVDVECVTCTVFVHIYHVPWRP